MKVGYARTTTLEQTAGFEAHVRDLTATDCEKVFKEQLSSVGGRQQLAAALDFVRSGDTLAVTKLDRLARSIGHLSEITKALESETINLTGILYGTELVLTPLLKSAIC